MKLLSDDLSPAAERILLDGWSTRSAADKLERVRALNRMVQQLQLSQLQQQHPDADASELRLRLAGRWLGPDLAEKVFRSSTGVENEAL